MDDFGAIRKLAATVLKQYEDKVRKPASTAESGSHANLNDLAFQCFQLTVAADPTLDDNVLGVLDVEGGVIGVNCSLMPERFAFTVAHEIGHKALGHPPRVVPDTDAEIDEEPDYTALAVQNGVYRTYDERDRMELEANVFAAELLAPIDLIRKRVAEDLDWTVKSLSEYFGLSRSAMLNHLVVALLPGPVEEPRVIEQGSKPRKPDPMQQHAVSVPTPALVIAGPGAGKTRILVDRFSRLVNEGVQPRRILALTFANKAAEEMRERLSRELPGHEHEVVVSTFHSFGLDLLKGYGRYLGLKRPAKLVTPVDAYTLVKNQLATMPMGAFEDIKQPARNVPLLISATSRAKDELVGPEEFMGLVQAWITVIEARDPDQVTDQARDELARCISAAEFYAAYQALLRENGALDYGDLIAESVRLMDVPQVADEIRGGYDFILVDEFQDINYASGRLIQRLDNGRGIVWAVGDPKQSIYRFRGASPSSILRFVEDYPGATIVPLENNYRSVEDIVECGQAVDMPARTDGKALPIPQLKSSRNRAGSDAAATLVTAADIASEMSEMVGGVEKALESHPRREIAVLCRTHSQAQKISDALEEAGIPTTWSGALQERAAFKDCMGILYLACDDLRGVVRLARTKEFSIADQDLRKLTTWAAANATSALRLLHAASDGEIEGLSEATVAVAHELKRLGGHLQNQPTVFHAIAGCLFDQSRWCRRLIAQDRPDNRRTLAALGQVCNIARGFVHGLAASGGSVGPAEFVAYVESCIEAGEFGRSEDPSGADAVDVLTVHSSKGLEWPVVFVPFATSQWTPKGGHRESLPLPPGLIRDEDPNDEAIEEACLFYVAITRAKSQLYMSYAQKSGQQSRQPLPYVTQINDKLGGTDYLVTRSAQADPAARVMQPPIPPTTPYSFEEEPNYSSLSTYQMCPKRFEFQKILHLHEDRSGYVEFLSALRTAMQNVASKAESGELCTPEMAIAALDSVWADLGPTDHWYGPRYRHNAERLIVDYAAKRAPGSKVTLRKEFPLHADGRTIRVSIDELEHGDKVVLKKYHYGKPSESHRKRDDMPSLMLALAQEHYPGLEYDVRLVYPLLDLEESCLPTPRVVSNRVKKMTTLLDSAEAGQYDPEPDAIKCKTCYYGLICPSDSCVG